MEDLRYTIEPSQLHGLRNVTLIGLGMAVILAVGFALGVRAAGHLVAWAVGVVGWALIGGYFWVMYARAFTECTPAGLRTSGLAGLRKCAWPQVADIGPDPRSPNAFIVVTKTSGERFWLGAPVSFGVMRDPEFAAKLAQIHEYWRLVSDQPGPGG